MAVNNLGKETIIGILYRIFLWIARVPSFSTSRGSHKRSYHSPGLNIILSPDYNQDARNERRRIVHSNFKAFVKNILLSSQTSSSSWTSSTTGDLIGTESGVHMIHDSKDAMQWVNSKSPTFEQSSQVIKKEEKKRDIPPPITLLQGRGDYTGPRPWFLKREYIDGRLLLKAASVEYFEYIKATRDNGHLHMNLVSVDNSANCCHMINEQDDMTAEIVEGDDYYEEKSLVVLDDIDQNGMPISLAASLPEIMSMEKQMKKVDTLRKCLTYTEGMAAMSF